MTIDDDDLIPLARPRDNPTAQAYRLLADGLTLNEALTRLTRQPMGLVDRLLLDGRPAAVRLVGRRAVLQHYRADEGDTVVICPYPIAPAVDDTTGALRMLSSKIRRCSEDMKLLSESLHHELTRQSFGRRWARGPRRGNGMRRRAVYLKARRP